jgi:hypothetical protein
MRAMDGLEIQANREMCPEANRSPGASEGAEVIYDRAIVGAGFGGHVARQSSRGA